MSCRELVEIVTDYLEGAMSPAERARFERHVAGCRSCSRYLEQMRTTLAVLGRLDEDALPPAVRDRMLRVFRDWKQQPGQA